MEATGREIVRLTCICLHESDEQNVRGVTMYPQKHRMRNTGAFTFLAYFTLGAGKLRIEVHKKIKDMVRRWLNRKNTVARKRMTFVLPHSFYY